MVWSDADENKIENGRLIMDNDRNKINLYYYIFQINYSLISSKVLCFSAISIFNPSSISYLLTVNSFRFSSL